MKIFQYSFLWALIGTFYSTAQAQLSIHEEPTWVVQHSVSSKQTETKGYDTSYLLFDQQVKITDSEQAEFKRIVSKVNNTSGLAEQGKISIPFDPSYQELQVHHVTIIRNNETINVLNQVEFEVIRQEAELNQGIYNGREVALLLLEDLQINDVIDYAYTTIGKNPIFNNLIFEVFGLEWSVPVADLHITISTPKNKKIKYRTLKKQKKPKKTKHSDHVTYSWHIEQVKAIDYQGSYPQWFEVGDYLEVTEFSTWQQVAMWANDVFAIEMALNNETISLINAWQITHTDDLSKATKALQYVQDEIRYLGIEIGINSHKPRTPAETYATKYGDCKDKTMLLHAMLNAMNISSKPFLVSTTSGKSIIDRLPSPGLFDHVILQINIDDNLYWVDPTSIHQGSPLMNLSLPDFAYGLIIDEKTTDLTPINRKKTQQIKTSVTETLEIDEHGTDIPLTIETQHHGNFAEHWRARFASNTAQQIQNQFESYTSKMYGSASTSQEMLINDNIVENDLTIDEAYLLNKPWQQNNRFEFVETFAHTLLNYIELPSRINRNSPLGLVYPLEVNHQFIIEDTSKKLVAEQQDIQITTKQINYQKTVSKKGTQIIINHQFKTLSDHIKVDDLEDYYDAIKSIKDNLSVLVGLPIEQKTRLKDSNDRLKSALQKMLKEKNNEPQ